MSKTIKISKNTIIISLERYNNLLESENKVLNNTVYTKTIRSFLSKSENIFTNDEAVKELSKDLIESREEIEKLKEENSVLIAESLKKKNDFSWREISAILKNKIYSKK